MLVHNSSDELPADLQNVKRLLRVAFRSEPGRTRLMQALVGPVAEKLLHGCEKDASEADVERDVGG